MVVAIDEDDVTRRKRIRRNVVLLALLAVAFYVGFIVIMVMRGSQ
jgi:hypothetical protein